MSMSSSPPAAKTELETVVNWPLLVSAATLMALLLAVPVVLACIAALKGDAIKDKVAKAPTPPAAKLVRLAPRSKPVRAVVPTQPKERPTPLPIYVEAGRTPRKWTPRPAAVVTSTPPPALNPLLQLPEVNKPIFKRLDDMPESYLLRHFAEQAAEVDLERVKGTREKLLAKGREDKDKKNPPILALCAERADLKGLPMRQGADCQARPAAVKTMQEISTRAAANHRQIGPH